MSQFGASGTQKRKVSFRAQTGPKIESRWGVSAKGPVSVRLHPQTAGQPGQEAGQQLLTLLLGAPGALEPLLESRVTVDVERSIPQRRWWRARRGASRKCNKPGAAPLEAGRVGTAQASSAGRGSAGAGLRPGSGRSRGGSRTRLTRQAAFSP